MDFLKSKLFILGWSVLSFFWLAITLQAQPADYYVPQVVDGGGYKTLFTVTNLSASSIAQFSIQVTLDSGSPAAILNIPGQTGPQSSGNVTVQPGGQVTLSTIGGASLSVGWADISSSSSVGVSAVFLVVDGSGNVTSAAGILPQPSQSTATLVGLIKTSAKTGVAVLNSSLTSAHLMFQLFDVNGAQVSTNKTITLTPRGQAGSKIAQFFDEGQLFVGVTNFEGSVSITSDVPVQILSLRLDFPSNNLTTLPTLAGRAGAPLQHADATFAWVDASTAAGGSRVALAGDTTTGDVNGPSNPPTQPAISTMTAISVPFPITLYGKTFGNSLFDQITVAEDGWISFGSAFSPTQAGLVPLPTTSLSPSLVAPFLINMHFNANNTSVGVFTRVVGTAPNRQFVVEWINVSFVNTSLGTATFEIVFYEGTSDVKFQYQAVGNSVSGAISGGLVIGIQDDTRTQAVPINLGVTGNQPRANKVYTFQYLGGSNYNLVQN